MELKLGLFVFSLHVLLCVLLTVKCVSPTMNDILEKTDASDITWAHAVNSIQALEKELIGPVNFLEADISMGHDLMHPSERFPAAPIMAHPPNNVSDISFETWLDKVIKSRIKKGIKLDFKSLEVVEPSLSILLGRIQEMNFPLWLNADVLYGPVGASTQPVQPDHFLSLCHQYYHAAVLSIGWTTYFDDKVSPISWEYQWKHVRQMADIIRCHGYNNPDPKYTFPVRAIFASRSIKQLQWLLGVVPGSTLTVWSAQSDSIQVEDLLRIRAAFPKAKVYYDIPEPINSDFRKVKNDISNTPLNYPLSRDDRWMTVTKGQGDPCESFTYINNNTIVFGRSVKSAVLLKQALVVDDYRHLKVKGKIAFFKDSISPKASNTSQELVIVLADISLFSKNYTAGGDQIDLSQSDTDVIWSAMNASFLHKFEHVLSDEKSACRVFSLDTTNERAFEAWTVSCDSLQENAPIEEAIKNGIPEISNRKRLVLPKGPFMLGFFSSGEEYAAMYDINIEGTSEGFTSEAIRGKSNLMSPVFLSILLAVMKYFLV